MKRLYPENQSVMTTRRLFLNILLLFSLHAFPASGFVWFDGKQPVSYSVTASKPVVSVALNMFHDDLKQVTGTVPQQLSEKNAKIAIIQLDDKNLSAAQKQILQRKGIPVNDLSSKKDAFFMAVIGRGAGAKLYIVGSDGRGTAYGILELSRKAGVSPWVWWSDVTPEKQNKLTLPAGFSTFQSPSVEFRGIFLNDEDWSMQPWSWMNFEPSDIKGKIGARTYKEIFKLLMRLRANAIWPGMHGTTTPFYFVPGAKEAADSCGIVIGTSHCEPLMRNNVGEWDENKRGRYNYITNKQSVTDYWVERLREVDDKENVYTIGMRGVHDGAMEGVKTMKEQTEALQRVIYDQRNLLKQYVDPNVEQIPQQFVPYKEVLQIYENGLDVPDDVMLTWCDDNYGYMTRLSDAQQQKRSGGAGVYYHLSYWGRPHDYLWLTTTQPGLIYNEMREAYNHNARRLWIVNVHDLKPAAYDLEFFLDMAWDINSITPSTIRDHQAEWLKREFGDLAGKKLLPAMMEFYRLCGIRKPEFMGWTQVELDKKLYARGWSPLKDTEFSLSEFGGELDRYLEAYENIKQTVADVEKIIPANRKDAFFSHIKYPVFSAAAMSTKMLEAQRARAIASGSYDFGRWERDHELMVACAKSMNAYQEIRRLTDYYNNEMSGGKWKHSMVYNPRDLYVFYAPLLPMAPTDAEIEKFSSGVNPKSKSLTDIKNDSFIAANACNFSKATAGATPVQSLGHSMNAVSLPKGGSLTYEFESPWEGEAVLRTAVIPTQPNDKGDIRFSVSIDGGQPQICSYKEKFRSDAWKENVMRGQAIRNTTHTLAKGKHTLVITALDNHVVVDQWMLDFKPQRSFYLFPLDASY